MSTLQKVSGLLGVFPKRTLDFKNLAQSITSVKLHVDSLHCSSRVALNENDSSKSDREETDFVHNEYSVDDEDFDKHVCLSNLHLTEEELTQHPIRRFTGNIYVVKEPSNEREFEILCALNKLKGQKVLGFDVEMTESTRLNGSHRRTKRTRVVQVASEKDAIVWQLRNFTSLPSSLVFFLKSDILKVGHAISDDMVLLKKEFNIKSRCLFDTLPWAMELDCKPLGLHALCAIFLGWKISKGLRTSDWSRSDLSENQIHYACTDAWASLMLYKKMKRVAFENGNVLPLPIASVNDILDTRLLSKRKRRNRLVQNNKARKNFNIIAEIATKVVE